MKKANYINKLPNGTPLGNEKGFHIASFCDEELTELPELNLVPEGLVLVCVVDNGAFEAAMICDNEYDWNRVKTAIDKGDQRPTRFFLLKKEWTRQMAEFPLESDGGQRGGKYE